eukprot:4797207-Pyramimonas_sp.AAC.1
MKHLVTECNGYERFRTYLNAHYSPPDGFWTMLPRCSSKSGWTTYAASDCAVTRARMLLAICELGVHSASQSLEDRLVDVGPIRPGRAGRRPA